MLDLPEGVIAARVPLGQGVLVHFAFRFPWLQDEESRLSLDSIIRSLVLPAEIEPCYPTSDPTVETELHESGERRFLFIANPNSEGRRVIVQLRPAEALREVRGVGRHLREGELLRVPARGVLIREVVSL